MPVNTKKSSTTTSDIPIIQLQFISPITMQEFEQWLMDMTGLLAKKQPFFAIYHSEPKLLLPENYRVQEAAWYKSHKTEFFQYCKGLVRIANDEAERVKLNSPAMHQAWQVPYSVVMNQAQAIAWLEQQILENNG